MYDENLLSSDRTEDMPRDARPALSVGEEVAETTLALLDRLQSAFVELSTALNETLRGQRSDAAACIQRAQSILQGTHCRAPQPAENTVPQGLAPWQVSKVLAHIEANLSTPIRNKDLAALVRLSEFHFNVTFRNSVGAAPHGYIIRRRVERAQGLMLSTDRPLSDIAAECGLADQPHLTRLFRRFVGESPAAWRRRASGGASDLRMRPALSPRRGS